MRYFLSIIVFGLFLAFAVSGYSQEPEVSACDVYDGAAYGLCNAYCEAMDCDGADPQASDTACGRVLDNFFNALGEEIPPCELPNVCSDEVLAQCPGAETVICNGKFQCTQALRGDRCVGVGCAIPVP